MDAEAWWGALIMVWVLIVIPPFFILAARTVSDGKTDPKTEMRYMAFAAPWIVGLVFLLGAWKLSMRPEVAASVLAAGTVAYFAARYLVKRN